MQKSSKIIKLLILALIILFPTACWKIRYPSYTYRYKVIVEVETPEGLKTGSSVVEVHTNQYPGWLILSSSDVASEMKIKGEGTIVDITEGKTLFVLLNGAVSEGRPHALIHSAIPVPSDEYKNDIRKFNKFYGTLKDARGVLPKDKYPRMVYFEDINQPISVKKINQENFGEVFGEGVNIKQIIVESTNDELEWKIWERLKWLPDYYGGRKFDGNRYQANESTNKFANSLGASSFSIKE